MALAALDRVGLSSRVHHFPLPALGRAAAAGRDRARDRGPARTCSWPTSPRATSTARWATRSWRSSAELNRAEQTTVVMVTHDPAARPRRPARIVRLFDGRQVQLRPPCCATTSSSRSRSCSAEGLHRRQPVRHQLHPDGAGHGHGLPRPRRSRRWPPETRAGPDAAASTDRADDGAENRWTSDLPGTRSSTATRATSPGSSGCRIFPIPVMVNSVPERGRAHRVYLQAHGRRVLDRSSDFEFLEGGPFSAKDDEERSRVAVINATTRQRFFGDQPAVGQTIEADGQRFRVVGVVAGRARAAAGSLRRHLGAPHHHQDRTLPPRARWATSCAIYLAPTARPTSRGIREEFRSRAEARRAAGPEALRPHGGRAADTTSRLASSSRMLFEPPTADEEPAPAGCSAGCSASLRSLFMLLPAVNLVNLSASAASSSAPPRSACARPSAPRRGRWSASSWSRTSSSLWSGGCSGFVLVAASSSSAINGSGLFPYAHFTLNPRVFLYGLGSGRSSSACCPGSTRPGGCRASIRWRRCKGSTR